jgi:hypothetical protein
MDTNRYPLGWMQTGMAALLLALATCAPKPPANTPANPPPPSDSITHNAMSFNAMSFNALMLHENVKLKDYSLEQVVAPGSPFETDLANDPYSVEFLEYLVGCALPQGDELIGQNQTWPGELGLCPAWKTSAPDLACQELVSSCLLARSNAYGESVQISLRGLYTDDTTPLPISVAEEDQFVWQEGGFFGNVFCPDCTDSQLSMLVRNGQLVYRLIDRQEPSRTIEVACEPTAGRSVAEAYRMRNQCHINFLQTTQYVGVVYKSMFACWSPAWADGEAYTRRRICAGAASTGGVIADQEQCAAWPVGACGQSSAMVACQTKDVCDVLDTAPRPKDGDVDDCAGQPQDADALPAPGTCPAPPAQSAPVWQHPITVFLAEPFAIVPQADAGRLNPEYVDPLTGRPRQTSTGATTPR